MSGLNSPDAGDETSDLRQPHALFKAAFDGSVQELARLLEGGQDPNTPFVHPDLGCWTPLHAACRTRHLEVVEILLAAGGSANAVDEVSRFQNQARPTLCRQLNLTCAAARSTMPHRCTLLPASATHRSSNGCWAQART